MKKVSTKTILFLLLLVLGGWALLAPMKRFSSPQITYLEEQKQWADSVLNTMTLDQKIGQLFVISAYSNRNETHYRDVENLIRNYHVGGILFFQGTPLQQAILTNRYQAASKVPLFITIDAEWGLGMRLDNTMSFPKQITLGAIQDDFLVQQMGEEIGRQCNRLGININYAPVADINTNPNNPVINYRSFGESKFNVATKAAAYARGMQNRHVLASAKHFPGHGDTDTDSHFSMPVVGKTKAQLTETELYPFEYLVRDSIASIMTGHLYVPSLDNGSNRSGTVSKKIVTDLLKDKMGFRGLAVTDALVMGGLTRYYSNGNAELQAYKAGNDLLLQPGNVGVAFNKIKNAFASGELSVNELDERIRNVLKSKYWAGLNTQTYIDIKNLDQDLNTADGQLIKSQLFNNAVTIVNDQSGMLPFKKLDILKYASISISPGMDATFQKNLDRHGIFKHFTIPFKPSKNADWNKIADEAADYDIVVIGVHDTHSVRSRNYGITPATVELINSLQRTTKVVVCMFGNPYGLRLFDDSEHLVCGYEDVPEAHNAVVEVLFGALAAKGKLPVTVNRKLKLEDGILTNPVGRLREGTPDKVGMDAGRLSEIDDIALESIQQGAFPGCQVVVAREGTVVYNKSFGNLRYDNSEPVTNETLYDLASLTKVTATLQSVMLLNERGEIDLEQPVSFYLPELRGTTKEGMIISDVLQHQAGLKSFIPFWVNTKSKNGSFLNAFYRFQPGSGYLQVADNLFINPKIKDDVLQWIIESDMTTRTDGRGGYRYLYSDLGLILLQRVVERVSNMPLDEFTNLFFYEPLGMTTTTFNPLQKFPKERIAPTEYDKVFRGRQIQGTVHDPNAALLGGVAGHAGLFSNAWDLAKLFQMNLQKGYYAEYQYLFPNTVPHFTKNYTSKSHRGLGWNKPTGEDQASVASMASANTFGHTGFTGTVVWIDPDKELIFIMLANRVYPDERNRKLNQLEVRKRMHEAVYNSIVYF